MSNVNEFVATKYEKCRYTEINTSVQFPSMKKIIGMIEDKGKARRRESTHWNPKRHIPLMSLPLWQKMVVIYDALFIL